MAKYYIEINTGKTEIVITKLNGKRWNKKDYAECLERGFVSNGFKNIAFNLLNEHYIRKAFTLDAVVSSELMEMYRALPALGFDEVI